MKNTLIPLSSLLRDKFENALSYRKYRSLINNLLQEDKTTGENHSESMLQYTRMNVVRMKRLDRTIRLQSKLVKEIQRLQHQYYWLAISEAWCGDAAQNLPLIAALAEESQNVELRITLRDENLDLMRYFLTNGSRSIPKVILIEAGNFRVQGVWGPRPAPVQKMVLAHKADPDGQSYAEFSREVQLWYKKDKTVTLQAEWYKLLKGMR